MMVAIVAVRPAWCADPGGGEKLVLAHQAQHAPPRGADAGDPQPGPDLAMAFPMKRAGGADRSP